MPYTKKKTEQLRTITTFNYEDIPFTGQRQHFLSALGISHALQTHEVKS